MGARNLVAQSQLAAETVAAISTLRDSGLSQRQVAERLNISRWQVRTHYAPAGAGARIEARSHQCKWPGCVATPELGWTLCSYHRKKSLGLIG